MTNDLSQRIVGTWELIGEAKSQDGSVVKKWTVSYFADGTSQASAELDCLGSPAHISGSGTWRFNGNILNTQGKSTLTQKGWFKPRVTEIEESAMERIEFESNDCYVSTALGIDHEFRNRFRRIG